MNGRLVAAAVSAAAVVATFGVACARDGEAQASAPSTSIVADDPASLERLLSVMRGLDPFVCEVVTRSVGMQGSWSPWGSVGDFALQADSASAALLGWIHRSHNDPAVVPRLQSALQDSDGCVRRVGGAFLARVHHALATAALMRALDDARPEVREVAALGVGLAEHHEGAEGLIKHLKDDVPAVRRAAAWALGSLEAPRRAIEPLTDMLAGDPDPRARQAAAWAIGNIH